MKIDTIEDLTLQQFLNSPLTPSQIELGWSFEITETGDQKKFIFGPSGLVFKDIEEDIPGKLIAYEGKLKITLINDLDTGFQLPIDTRNLANLPANLEELIIDDSKYFFNHLVEAWEFINKQCQSVDRSQILFSRSKNKIFILPTIIDSQL